MYLLSLRYQPPPTASPQNFQNMNYPPPASPYSQQYTYSLPPPARFEPTSPLNLTAHEPMVTAEEVAELEAHTGENNEKEMTEL